MAIGVLLLLFGLRWLRKAMLRSAGVIPLHDETAAYTEEAAALSLAPKRAEEHLDWIAGLVAFKAVVLEGLEVVFIVIAVGAGRGLDRPGPRACRPFDPHGQGLLGGKRHGARPSRGSASQARRAQGA